MDVDGTLIKIKTMFSFLEFYYRNKKLGALRFKSYMLFTKFYELLKIDRSFLNKRYYKSFKNNDIEYVHRLGKKWFEEKFNTDLLIFNVVKELRDHRSNGAEIVMVSGSFSPCLEPIANLLGVQHILATELYIKDSKYTGEIKFPQTIGQGKALRIREFLEKHNDVTSEICFAYGDHESDLPMLKTVGHACVVAGDKTLEKAAELNHWKIIH